MEKNLFIHIYDHSIFFKKWLRHTKDTPIMAFTSDYEKSRTSFTYFLKIVESALTEDLDKLTIMSMQSNMKFMEELRRLIRSHVERTDIDSFLMSVKLFKQCLLEMIEESCIKDKCGIMIAVSMVFDVIEINIVEIFHVSALQKLKDILYQLCMENKAERGSPAPLTFEKLSRLTQSEYAVCELIVDNLTTKEISEKLNVSTETVHTHRKHIRKKLNIPSNQNLYSYLKYLI